MYNQESKIEVRNNIWNNAINLLTNNREKAACIDSNYVRRLIEHMKYIEDGTNKVEVSQIDYSTLLSYEDLYRYTVSHKNPKELKICYLAGPEPENDFNVLIKLGVHPQNIWAFEKEKDYYNKAISKYAKSTFPIPRIINTSIESFFKHSPIIFDIVYIDGCGHAFPSSQHTMRIISSLLKFKRLNTLGIIITNFSSPNRINDDNIKYLYNSCITSKMILPK